jgi:hypothetical protein
VADEPADDLTDEERVLFGSYALAAELAKGCRRLREMKVSTSDKALRYIVNALMTEFWDQGFSQTENQGRFYGRAGRRESLCGGRRASFFGG